MTNQDRVRWGLRQVINASGLKRDELEQIMMEELSIAFPDKVLTDKEYKEQVLDKVHDDDLNPWRRRK